MSVGELIKMERIRNRLSQEDVAKAIGSTKQAVYKYENGIVTNIPMDKIEILSSLFGVTPSYLMGWEESPTNNSPTEAQLSEGEMKLVELFRQLPEESQRMYLEVLRATLKNQA